jgi:cytochrome oxidase Cu insertion factor (SCO1/SenC/PrrC family)
LEILVGLSACDKIKVEIMTTKIEIGEKSKEFSLHDQNNKVFRLTDFLGKVTVDLPVACDN